MTPDDVLKAFEASDAEGYSIPEVASALGISKPAAWNAIEELESRGLLEKRPNSGMGSDTWTLTEIGEEHLQSRINSF